MAADYRYAHDEPEGFAAGETYWPEGRAQRSVLRAGGSRPEQQASPSALAQLRALNGKPADPE